MPLSVLLLSAGGCDGVQSALDPAGLEAERVADLFWLMLAGAALVWVLVIGTAVYATRFKRGPHREAAARWFVLGGGVAAPVVALAVLLAYGLSLMSDLRAAGPADLRIAVSGEQWWWRVRYGSGEDGGTVESANELRLPAGARVELLLDSPDVIHSLWIPALGGKLDMIPGRTTRLTLEPSRPGDFRGVCAEFCGDSHALMAFPVRVMGAEAFGDWLGREAAPAVAPSSGRAMEGAELFVAVGCGGCHSVRGTEADGTIGPDLTHVGSRAALAAGTLPMTEAAIARFISNPSAIKPGAKMPAFGVLGEDRIAAIAAYLMGLE